MYFPETEYLKHKEVCAVEVRYCPKYNVQKQEKHQSVANYCNIFSAETRVKKSLKAT